MKGVIMAVNKRLTVQNSRSELSKNTMSYADAPFVKKKLTIAKEILKDVKLPDHWLTK
ncbi:hypothetical protein [Pedobacter sp. MC2016-15]|uniref:hypothetical protein n=1 Tax=Pedobacter sp. MC2016-15 TaxID=2994473 RepID=UPI002247DEB7|nr:hypothetical protein [Pedobacter sp. MC2016-15]